MYRIAQRCDGATLTYKLQRQQRYIPMAAKPTDEEKQIEALERPQKARQRTKYFAKQAVVAASRRNSCASLALRHNQTMLAGSQKASLEPNRVH